jgi:hypothetical protein
MADADLAEAYALDAIDFAGAALDEAAYAALDAIEARAYAGTLKSKA